MHNKMLRSGAMTFAIAAALILCPSCRGGLAASTEKLLPAPQADDSPAGSPPELPRLSVELPPDASGSSTRILAGGDDLQRALEDAVPGNVIALRPGAIFRGPFRLPKKSGDGWITIRTNTADAVFPRRGTRVDPSMAGLMPVIESSTDTAMMAEAGAHHYRFIGIEFRPQANSYLTNVITLGSDERSIDEMPHHVVIERCYVHADARLGSRRGIALNSMYTAVVDSYVSGFKEKGADSQAIAGWNGPGPFLIANNYLEGAGENLIFGGADPQVTNLVPSDIVIRGNHLAKLRQWKAGDPAFEGTEWTVKNLFELKNARRVLVEDNLFESNWAQSQNGFAILFTPRNQDGAAPWSTVRDVTFVRNSVKNSSSAINILGTDDINTSLQTKRIVIRDNRFENIGGEWGGAGRLFQILSGTADVVIDHNTAFHTGDVIVADGAPNTGFVYTNNLSPHNEYGVGGTGTFGSPLKTLATFFPGATFLNNVLIGGSADEYPPSNFFPSTAGDVGFVNLAGADYRLSSTSKYKAAATDGKDIGANLSDQASPVRSRAVRKRG